MLEDIFYFTKKERRQLIKMITIVISLIYVNSLFINVPTIKIKDKNTQVILSTEEKSTPKKKRQKSPIQLHSFNPNTVDRAELENMNLPKKGIKSLMNYRQKGGYIKNISDFKRMYGFEKLQDSLLIKHLHFTKTNDNKTVNPSKPKFIKKPIDTLSKNQFYFDSISYKPAIKTYARNYKKKVFPKEKLFIEINSADTSSLQQLNGIGPIRAMMIVKFREALGGYHSLSQLTEVHYLPDSIVQNISDQIYIDSIDIRKIKMNLANQKELSSHPYINWQEAKMLYNYTKEHGPIKEFKNLYQMRGLDSTFLLRIQPYLDLGE